MPLSSRNVIEKISEEYYDLTTAEKKTADYVLRNPRESQFLSIAELAEESGVAEATVSRFCRRLGYKGYNAFKLAIANATARQHVGGEGLSGQIEESDSMEDMCRKLYSADVAAVTETLNLLNPEQIRMFHQCFVLRRDRTEIRTHHQRNAAQAPEGELHPVFLIGTYFTETDVSASIHPNGQHIHVVETADTAHAEVIQLGFEDICKGCIVIHNVAGGTVQMRADTPHPFPWFLLAPVAGRENDIPPCGLQRHRHRLVAGTAVAGFREIAEIIFQIIHTPGGKGFGICKLMIIAGRISGAGHNAGTGIHSEFQAFSMNIIRKVLHSMGEFFRIRNQTPSGIPFTE